MYNQKEISSNKFLDRSWLFTITKEIVSFSCFSCGSIISKEFLRILLPLLVIWEIIPRINIVPKTLFPPFSEILMTFVQMIVHKNLIVHLLSSMVTFFSGFFVSVIIAVPIGLILGWNHIIRKHTLPLFQILAPIPPPAWVPITIIFFGIGLSMKVFLVSLGAFYPILFNTYQAVKDTDSRYLASARILGASEYTLFTHIFIWHSLGAIIMSIRTGIIMGLIMLTVAEMYGARSGIGFLLIDAKEFFQIPSMIVCMGILGGIGWFLSEILKYIEVKLSRWKTNEETE